MIDPSLQTLTVQEAAKLLKFNRVHLWRLLNKGVIPGFQIGGKGSWRLPAETFRDWLWLEATKNLSPQIKQAMQAIRPIKEKFEPIKINNRYLVWDEQSKEFKYMENVKT